MQAQSIAVDARILKHHVVKYGLARAVSQTKRYPLSERLCKIQFRVRKACFGQNHTNERFPTLSSFVRFLTGLCVRSPVRLFAVIPSSNFITAFLHTNSSSRNSVKQAVIVPKSISFNPDSIGSDLVYFTGEKERNSKLHVRTSSSQQENSL